MAFFRKPRPEEPEERDLGAIAWLQPNGLIKLLIFCFILYLFLGPYVFGDRARDVVPQAEGPEKQTQGRGLDALKPVEVSELDEVSVFGYRVMDKIREAGVVSRDLQPGGGAAAACGQRVSLAYVVTSEDGKARFPEQGAQEARFRLGAESPAFVNEGVAGMREGGQRRIYFRPEKTLDAAGGSPLPESLRRGAGRLVADVTLSRVEDPLPESAMGLRIFSRATGAGDGLGCGQSALLRYVAWDLQGAKLGEGGIAVTPGANTLPLGLEMGALGMRPGSMRTLILPPEYLLPRGEWNEEGKPLASLLAQGQAVMLDIARDRAGGSPNVTPKP